MAISSYQTVLKCGASSEALTKLCPIKDFPDLFGDPNLLETTTLDDNMQTNIPGILSSDTLAFTANWDKEIAAQIKEKEGTTQYWSLEFSDGSKFTWQGQATLGVPGKGVDEVVEMTINIVASTVITFDDGGGA